VYVLQSPVQVYPRGITGNPGHTRLKDSCFALCSDAVPFSNVNMMSNGTRWDDINADLGNM
jgi:hypothetical protein